MPNSRRPSKASSLELLVYELKEEFALFRQSSEIQSKERTEQLVRLEQYVAKNHDSTVRRFDSVNTHLNALMVADGKLRADLTEYIAKHDAPRMLVRIEESEKRIAALEKRNDRLDGAALAIRGLWILVGGVVGALLVAWLKA